MKTLARRLVDLERVFIQSLSDEEVEELARSMLGDFDFTTLTDAQLQRLVDGEDPYTVLSARNS